MLSLSLYLGDTSVIDKKQPDGYFFMTIHRIILFLVAIVISSSSKAEIWTLPPADIDIFGRIQSTVASRNETLLDIARLYGIGQIEILLANPRVDRWLPADGDQVIVPSRYVIPDAERKGLVLNLPEMRIYYFPEVKKGKKPVVITHPVSIGRMDWETPLGKTKIVGKRKNPTWTPPQSLKDDAIANGDPPLPDVVPAGPDNPLGLFAMRLGTANGSYLIHGTNKPYGVGMRVSHGCIRMYPEDIESLFGEVPVGTQIELVNQPIKLGWLADALFIELHPPLEEEAEAYKNYTQRVFEAINNFVEKKFMATDNNLNGFSINDQVLAQAIAEVNGVPTLISN